MVLLLLKKIAEVLPRLIFTRIAKVNYEFIIYTGNLIYPVKSHQDIAA